MRWPPKSAKYRRICPHLGQACADVDQLWASLVNIGQMLANLGPLLSRNAQSPANRDRTWRRACIDNSEIALGSRSCVILEWLRSGCRRGMETLSSKLRARRRRLRNFWQQHGFPRSVGIDLHSDGTSQRSPPARPSPSTGRCRRLEREWGRGGGGGRRRWTGGSGAGALGQCGGGGGGGGDGGGAKMCAPLA